MEGQLIPPPCDTVPQVNQIIQDCTKSFRNELDHLVTRARESKLPHKDFSTLVKKIEELKDRIAGGTYI